MEQLTLNILLIEDNPDDQVLFREVIADTSFARSSIHAANSLKSGFQYLFKQPVDILLLDLSLPDCIQMEGLLKIKYQFPRLPVIIMTGLNDEQIAVYAIQNGAQDYLLKGEYDHKLLDKSIHYAIERQKFNIKQQEAEEKLKKHMIELERANKELEEFSFVAAHDLKSPLSNLQSLLNIIAVNRKLNDECKDLIEKAKKCTLSMNNTIDALNEIIALKGNPDRKAEKIYFEDVLHEVEENINEQIEDSEAVINTGFSRCSYINYPPEHLKSIMQNLLTNAIKYKKRDTRPVIKISSGSNHGQTYLTVKDNGIGINLSQHKHKLFGLFKRFHNHVEGNGTGLYIIKTIVDLHGGNIDVSSEPNKGTTFKICLNNGNSTNGQYSSIGRR